MRSYILSVFIMCILAVAMSLPLYILEGSSNENYTVAVFSPKQTLSKNYKIIHNADGYIVNHTAFNAMIVTKSTDEHYQENLRNEGALFSFNFKLPTLCTS